ncbi:MAG: hypothetical protein HY046_13825 [Acidobacteria bacterium]|nr:hypothetical protein [Acidobacteriota bacterium]
MENEPVESTAAVANPFAGSDVITILREHGWLAENVSVDEWAARAAKLLGPQATTPGELTGLLRLVFEYDAKESLRLPEHQAAIIRDGARDVIRALGLEILSSDPARLLDSDRLKEVIDRLKTAMSFRGRSLFFPLRLALAGRTGDGDLDRVILLLDTASALPFAVHVKGTRERMVEFLAALD